MKAMRGTGTGQVTKCGYNGNGRRKPCLTCPDLLEGQAPELDANCQSNNVIYYLNCKSCQNLDYVGKTQRELNIRMKEH